METVVLVASLASMAYSVYSSEEASANQRKAAKEQRAIADMNAGAVEAETVEEARRLERQQKAEESMTKAKASASGITMEGSAAGFLGEQQAENVKQLSWLKRSGLSRASITRAGGQAAYRTGMAQAATTQRTGIAQGFASSTGAIDSWGTRTGRWD